jgi:hypothetical protein
MRAEAGARGGFESVERSAFAAIIPSAQDVIHRINEPGILDSIGFRKGSLLKQNLRGYF